MLEETPVVTPPEPEMTLAQHEAAADLGQTTAVAPDPEAPPKAPRHRARSQQAGAGDAPRIAELTRKLRETERERDELKTKTTAEVVARPATPTAPVAPKQPAAETTLGARPDASDSAKYPSGLYDPQYVEDLADWKFDQREQKKTQEQTEKTRAADLEKLTTAFDARFQAGLKTYPNLSKSLQANPTLIPKGSLIDLFIFESERGIDLLHDLYQHPEEVGRILAIQSPVLQVGELSLRQQRLSNPTGSQAAVGSGAAAPALSTPAPRPPTPLRTGPMRPVDEPLGEQATLADHEKVFGNGRRRH